MKTKYLKTIDKIMYVVARIIIFVTIAVISYFTILEGMNLLNYSKILIGSNLYNGFNKILNIVNSWAFPIILITLIGAIPYLITSVIVFIYFIIRYIKYIKRNLKKTVILFFTFVLTSILLITGVTTYPITQAYETDINSNISQISNTEMQDFITEQMKVSNDLKKDYYIYKIKIKQSFPDDYNGIIYYKDGINKGKKIYISDSMSNFIKTNMQNKTKELSIKGIYILIIGNILYIGFAILIQKDLKKIVKGNENINITEN